MKNFKNFDKITTRIAELDDNAIFRDFTYIKKCKNG
jgi:hypothetical protein